MEHPFPPEHGDPGWDPEPEPWKPSPPYRPEPEPVRTTYLQVLAKTAILIAILVANFSHLEWMRKRPQTRRTFVLRLLLIAFLPTYSTAELLYELVAFLGRSLSVESEQPNLRIDRKQWRRYLCSISGMYVVADPETEDDDTAAETANADAAGNEAASAEAASSNDIAGPPRPPLVAVRDATDLREHRRPWTFLVVVRIVLVILASFAALALHFLLEEWRQWRRSYGIDKRYICTAIGVIGCSVASLLILVSRREWSLMHLTTARRSTRQSYNYYCGMLIIATLLYEIVVVLTVNWFIAPPPILLFILAAPFGAFSPYGGSFGLPAIYLYFAFWIWFYWPQIRNRTTISPPLIWSFVLTLLSLVAVFDLLVLFSDDITSNWSR